MAKITELVMVRSRFEPRQFSPRKHDIHCYAILIAFKVCLGPSPQAGLREMLLNK